MKGIPVTTIRDTSRPDRRLELMLGVACLMLAAACLLMAFVVVWRTFAVAAKTANSAKPAEIAPVSASNSGSSQNDLQIQTAVRQQFHNATCCSSLREDKVTANVNGGTATLVGTVPSVGDRNSAEFLARIVMGVKGIDNKIVVSSPANETAMPAMAQRHSQSKAIVARSQKSSQIIHRATPENDESAEIKTWVDLGNNRLNNGDYAGAIRYFNLALAVDPENKDAIAGLRRAKSAQRAEEKIIKRSA